MVGFPGIPEKEPHWAPCEANFRSSNASLVGADDDGNVDIAQRKAVSAFSKLV